MRILELRRLRQGLRGHVLHRLGVIEGRVGHVGIVVLRLRRLRVMELWWC